MLAKLVRPALAAVLVGSALWAVAAASLDDQGADDSGPDNRPNIVLIVTDDQTLAQMAALPRTRAVLGGTGVTFTNAVASYPLCCPSRATILTGQYVQNNGVRQNLASDSNNPAAVHGRLRGVRRG